MSDPTDPAAVEAWRAAYAAVYGCEITHPAYMYGNAYPILQSYGDQREAAARADERVKIAELEAQVKRMEFDLEAAQCLMDSQYKAGVKLGWDLCASDDEAGYQRVTCGTEHIAELKRIRAERRAHFLSVLAEDDGRDMS